VEEQVRQLGAILGTGGADANAVLLRLLEDGVTVREAADPGRKRAHLVGTLTLRVRGLVGDVQGADKAAAADAGSGPIEIEFRETSPWAALASRAKELFDAGVGYEDMAGRLGCPPHWVPKALAWWHAERGLAAPDGRAVRARLHRPTQAETLADKVMPLWDAGLPMQDRGSRAR
jgi:hypothetical protein